MSPRDGGGRPPGGVSAAAAGAAAGAGTVAATAAVFAAGRSERPVDADGGGDFRGAAATTATPGTRIDLAGGVAEAEAEAEPEADVAAAGEAAAGLREPEG